MGGEGKHEVDNLKKIEHQSVSTYEDGQCLARHLGNYTENNSCSYRWQGLKKAEENKQIYNAHRGFHPREAESYYLGKYGNTAFAKNSIDQGFGGKIGFFFNTFTIQKTKKSTGVKFDQKMQEVAALNFTNGRVPYANEVHHILPHAELRDGLDTKIKEGRTIQHICNSLLKEKYNLNYKDNMIVLPKTKGHGNEIGLPTHPNNHQKDYKTNLRTYVNKAINKAQSTMQQGEAHDKLDYLKIKKNFEEISDEMYDFLAQPAVMPRYTIFGGSKNTPELDELKNFPRINFK